MQTSSAAGITSTRRYDAFGNIVATTGSTWNGPFGYGGKFGYQTEGSGLQLLGHRWYDAEVGRFLTRDPIGEGRNWYAYCGNDPVSGVDPDGLVPTWTKILGLIWAAIVGEAPTEPPPLPVRPPPPISRTLPPSGGGGGGSGGGGALPILLLVAADALIHGLQEVINHRKTIQSYVDAIDEDDGSENQPDPGNGGSPGPGLGQGGPLAGSPPAGSGGGFSDPGGPINVPLPTVGVIGGGGWGWFFG